MKPLNEMAYSRDDYKLRIRERLSGALGEFMKSKLAEANGLGTHRKHGHLVVSWRREAERLLANNVFDAMLSSMKGGDRGRRKAAAEAIAAKREQPTARLELWAKGTVEEIFGAKLKRGLREGALDGFWSKVQETFDAAFPLK